jgi:hypothetical protein
MKVKRISDGWIFDGVFQNYSPIRPRIKVAELQSIRGVSRWQGFGQAGCMAKWTLCFLDSEPLCQFMSKMHEEHEFTDEFGKVYRGIFREEQPEVGEPLGVGLKGVYQVQVQFFSSDIAGVGVV